MITLGIETSCDETACALIEDDRRVLADRVASQVPQHRPFKGVVPEIACREHVRTLYPVLEETFRAANQRLDQVGLVSVTSGPGLIGALMVGLSLAKSLSQAAHIPLIGVNHLEAHLEPFFLGRRRRLLRFPFIGLVASGGHTCLVEVRNTDHYKLLGETRDDAAGEAFDKAAKILGLGFPGGPAVERCAKGGDRKRVKLPSALSVPGFDFSYSGLKTAVLYAADAQGLRADKRTGCASSNRTLLRDLCAAFQYAVINSLVQKAVDACRMLHIRRLVVGGGVAANGLLARSMRTAARANGIRLFYPERAMTTDNAVMIALRGYRLWRKRGSDSLNLAVHPSLPFTRPAMKSVKRRRAGLAV